MKKYGLIGKSLSHSFSPVFFNDFFQKNNINAQYDTYEIDSIEEVKNIFLQNNNGFNVTIPYKESIIAFLDEIDPEAKEIGAVNTIVFKKNRSIGYNTDAFGFKQSIKPFLTNKHECALIFGTGGSAKAVAYVFEKIGIKVLYISRNPEKKKNHFSYEDVNENMINMCKVIVNCTPLGMHPNTKSCIDIPFTFLGSEHLVIDLIYNPVKTLFLKNAEKQAATILNGTSMLKEQAMESWRLWHGLLDIR
jgi:shikimate dehydrogenase